jgi:CRISPR-associated protein Cas2
LGTLEKNQFDSIQLQVEELIDEDKDSIYIFPMSKDELQQTVILGQAFDKDFVTDEVRSLFF